MDQIVHTIIRLIQDRVSQLISLLKIDTTRVRFKILKNIISIFSRPIKHKTHRVDNNLLSQTLLVINLFQIVESRLNHPWVLLTKVKRKSLWFKNAKNQFLIKKRAQIKTQSQVPQVKVCRTRSFLILVITQSLQQKRLQHQFKPADSTKINIQKLFNQRIQSQPKIVKNKV